MRRLLLSMLLSVVIAAPAAAGGPDKRLREKLGLQRTLHPAMFEARPEVIREMKRFERLRRNAARKGKAFNPIVITDTDILFDADEAAGTIATESTVTVEATEDGVASGEFSIFMFDSFAVETTGGDPLTYDYDDLYGIAEVTFPSTLNTGDTVEIVFKNAGDPGCGPDDFFGIEFCAVTEQIVYFALSDWMPTKTAYSADDFSDRTFYDASITTPSGFVAVTTSDKVSEDDLGAETAHHFTGMFPSSYFGLAYAEYEMFGAETSDGAPVNAFVHMGSTDAAQDWADIGADIIDAFSDWFSPYLYNKHDLIQTLDILGGGVGPQSATFYYASAFTTPPTDWPAESIFSHEIGHQWWGNMIGLGDAVSPWLNEGFAEYSSRLYGYEVWPSYYQDYLYELYFRYFQWYVLPNGEAPMSSYDLFSLDALGYQAITYWKGSHFLRMLQWYLGDDVFEDAMRTYAETYRQDESEEVVTVDKFRASLEASTGADLSGVFDRWVSRTGFPVYEWAAEFGENGEGSTARIRAEQVQDGNLIYDMPLAVSIWSGDADEPEIFRLEFEGKIADETFLLDGEPRGVKVDDAFWIWGDKIPVLTGDVNGSNTVDGVDFIYLAWAQGGEAASYEHWNYYTETDLNRDGRVDAEDLDLFNETFGEKGRIDD